MVRHTASWERLSPNEKSLIRRYSKKEVIERLTAYRLERLLSGEPTLAVSQSALPLRSELPAVWLAEQQFLPAWSDLNPRPQSSL